MRRGARFNMIAAPGAVGEGGAKAGRTLIMNEKNAVPWAYLCVFIGVTGHASSEFFVVLSGIKGAEVSVWRYLVGSAGLLLVALARPTTRDLITPLREQGLRIVLLSLFGMGMGQLFFHWSLDFATVTQVATMVTTMPILVVILDHLIHKGPISTPKMISGLGAFCGVVLLLTDDYLGQLGGAGATMPGMLLALASAAVAPHSRTASRSPADARR